MTRDKKIVIVVFLIILIWLYIANTETLKIDKDKNIEINITNKGTRSDILQKSNKDELVNILNGAKLKIYLKEELIFGDKTYHIDLYGDAVANSRFPIHIYYFIDRPYDSFCTINNKSYSIDKAVIEKLTNYYIENY